MTSNATPFRAYQDLLFSEIQPAIGCTEPVAIAFCASAAAEGLGAPVQRLAAEVSGYILKNGMHVGIPGTHGLTGVPLAAAIGSLLQHSNLEMEIFSAVTQDVVSQAQRMLRQGDVTVRAADTAEKVLIDVRAFDAEGHCSRAVVQGAHTHLVLLEYDSKPMYKAPYQAETVLERPDICLEEIYTFCTEVPLDVLLPLEKVIQVNTEVARYGLTEECGLSVGRASEADKTVSFVAAAVDARMAGCTLPVMTNMGSGNQGLVASLPLVEMSRQQGSTREQLLRALALSELVAMDVKLHIGRLSVLCGCCISAGIGAACGMTMLLGGGWKQIEYAFQTMAADVAGVICDGAKPGCALKAATAISAAERAAHLALKNGLACGHYGIVAQRPEKTLEHLAALGKEGMAGSNEQILRFMLEEVANPS